MTNPWNLPWQGGCRCDRVRFQVNGAPILTSACHCTGCQRMTGGPYSLSIAVPAERFEVIEGKPVLGGLQSSELRHFHCPFCKSWLYTQPAALEFMVNIRVSALDTRLWVVPFVETWTREKFPWVSTPAEYSFESVPELEAWEGIMKDFSLRGTRPS